MAIRATTSSGDLATGVSTEKLETSITFVRVHAEGIWTDADSKNQRFSEETPLAELQIIATIKPLADTTSLSDSTAIDYALPKTDNYSVSDTNDIAWGLAKTDDTLLSEVFASDYVKPTTDSANLSDVNGIVSALGKADTVSLPDTYSAGWQLPKLDGVSLLESSPISVTQPKIDGVAVADTPSWGLDLGRNEPVTLSETYGWSIHRLLSDGLALDDSTTVNKNYYGSKGNTFGFSDFNAAHLTKNIDDSISLNDSYFNAGLVFFRTPLDVMKVTDLTGTAALGTGQLGQVVLNQRQQSRLNYVRNRSAVDQTNISDINSYGLTKHANDSMGVADSLPIFNVNRAINDALAFTETNAITHGKVYGENVNMSDAVKLVLSAPRARLNQYQLNNQLL